MVSRLYRQKRTGKHKKHIPAAQKYTYFSIPTTFCLKSFEESLFLFIFAHDYTSYHNKAICRRFFNLKDRAQLFSFGYGLIFFAERREQRKIAEFLGEGSILDNHHALGGIVGQAVAIEGRIVLVVLGGIFLCACGQIVAAGTTRAVGPIGGSSAEGEGTGDTQSPIARGADEVVGARLVLPRRFRQRRSAHDEACDAARPTVGIEGGARCGDGRVAGRGDGVLQVGVGDGAPLAGTVERRQQRRRCGHGSIAQKGGVRSIDRHHIVRAGTHQPQQECTEKGEKRFEHRDEKKKYGAHL